MLLSKSNSTHTYFTQCTLYTCVQRTHTFIYVYECDIILHSFNTTFQFRKIYTVDASERERYNALRLLLTSLHYSNNFYTTINDYLYARLIHRDPYNENTKL